MKMFFPSFHALIRQPCSSRARKNAAALFAQPQARSVRSPPPTSPHHRLSGRQRQDRRTDRAQRPNILRPVRIRPAACHPRRLKTLYDRKAIVPMIARLMRHDLPAERLPQPAGASRPHALLWSILCISAFQSILMVRAHSMPSIFLYFEILRMIIATQDN
ncbi:hypothetical protein [Burkholderia sp. AW49-1]